ncbi:MAG: hypothetical protein ACR2KZ_04455 [Segetibacter sp.]
MKTFIFNIQAKGGAGKSMLTYLQALKREADTDSVFVDLDNSTKTSVKQLKFLGEKERLITTDIIDAFKRIEREKLFNVIEQLADTPFKEFYLDFGAPESEQLPNLFSMDFTVEEFKEFEASVKAKFVFNIVVSGGPAYRSCMEYASFVAEALKGKFDVYLFLNEFTFQSYPTLLDEVKQYVETNKKLIKGITHFGNISVDRNSGQNIMEFVKEGKGFSSYTGFATKTIMKREMQKV